MSEFAKTTEAEVEDTAETVIDDIIAGLGALSPLGSLITSLLTLCGVSTGSVATVLAFVAALAQFLTNWEDKLVVLIVSGYTAYDDLISFCKGLWQLFGGDDDSDAAVSSLAKLYSAKVRMRAVSRAHARTCVSDMQGYVADIASWLKANAAAGFTDQRAAVGAIAAKWKRTQAMRLSAATADAIPAV